MTRFAKSLTLFAALLVPVLGCQDKKEPYSQPQAKSQPADAHDAKAHLDADSKTAVAIIKPSKGAATQPANQSVTGTVAFTQVGDGVKVVADLTGLSPGKHGIHIHDKADLSAPDLSSAGGHWDPDGHKVHGGPTSEGEKRHAGDLGNIEADKDGKAHLEETIPGLTLGDGGKHDVVGHAVIVHAKEDDMKDIKSAGGRVAGGAIEVAGSVQIKLTR